MGEGYTTKKLGGDKVALLGLFVLALAAARFVVALKSAILLSEPVKLSAAGLTVSVPSGNGWRSEEKWEFQENEFVISSILTLASGNPVAYAHCRYLLAATPMAHQVRFEQRASNVDGTVIKTDQIQTTSLTIDWAHIEKPEILLDTFLGAAELPGGRQLEIEVNQITGDTELAARTFKAMVDSLDFKDNQLLGAGAEIVETIRKKGLSNLLDAQAQQSFYLIRDSAGRTIGFKSDVLSSSGGDSPFNIKSASFSYVEARHTTEQATSFQCSDKLDEFVYKSQARSAVGRDGVQTVLDKTGTMTVMQSEVRPEEKTYRLGPSSIPDVFLDQVLGRMLDSGKEKIIVDVVDTHGKITPTFISRMEAAKDDAGQDAVYAFKLELLDGRGFYEQFYLNERKQTYRMFLQWEETYIVERAAAEDIIREFPGYAQTILRNRQILK